MISPCPAEQFILLRNICSKWAGMCSATSKHMTTSNCLHGWNGTVKSDCLIRPDVSSSMLVTPSYPVTLRIPTVRSKRTYNPFPAPMSSRDTLRVPRPSKDATEVASCVSRWYARKPVGIFHRPVGLGCSLCLAQAGQARRSSSSSSERGARSISPFVRERHARGGHARTRTHSARAARAARVCCLRPPPSRPGMWTCGRTHTLTLLWRRTAPKTT